jgi:hypothetical protein
MFTIFMLLQGHTQENLNIAGILKKFSEFVAPTPANGLRIPNISENWLSLQS